MTPPNQRNMIVCVGDITPDIIIPYGETLQALSQLCEGKVVTCNPVLRPGGSVANTVATLGRLGLQPYMITGVGNDEYGDFLVHHLQECGVHVEYVYRQKERMSLILAVIDSKGERVIYLFNGPGAKLPEPTREQLPQDIIPHIAWVHANGFANDATVDYLEACAQAGAMVSFDLNLRCETFGFQADRKARILRAVEASNVLLGSGLEEFAPLTGKADLRSAVKALGKSDRIVVARDGHNPVHLYVDGQYETIPVMPTKVVNRVGGGDAFNGGFIAACAAGLSARDAVRWGNCCASCAISSHEPHSIPPKNIIEDMVAAHYTDY